MPAPQHHPQMPFEQPPPMPETGFREEGEYVEEPNDEDFRDHHQLKDRDEREGRRDRRRRSRSRSRSVFIFPAGLLVPYRQSRRGLQVCTLSVCQSVRLSVCLSVHSISFPDYFPKGLQILSCFLACRSITMTHRSSLSFVTLHRFLAILRALD